VEPAVIVPAAPEGASAAPVPAAGEVEREAEQLFGVLDPDTAVSFDIDVTSWAAHRRVLEYLRFFQTDARDRFSIWLSRLGRYEGMIRERLRHGGLPEDLVYLTLIESGLSNTAVSRAKAVGMWQFMASTGRLYGLEITPWVDERRDPFLATEAAVSHLGDLVRELGSVYLAAAAYNAGMGRVRRSLVKLPGDPAEFLSDQTYFELAERNYLRRETRDYVPKLIAAALIAKQPGRFGFTGIEPLQALVFDELIVPDATGLDVIARLTDTTLAALAELNPQFVRGITPPGRTVVVRVPRGRGESAAVRYAALPASDRVTFVRHAVARGETLSGIARGYGVSVAVIHGANPELEPRRLRIGQQLVVPLSGRHARPVTVAASPPVRRASAVAAPAATGGAAHRVRSGDTLSAIARRYGVSLSSLLAENGLSRDSVIKPGDRIHIPRGDVSGSAQ
jgi:membrane-bound lytic murein transglycosylase D